MSISEPQSVTVPEIALIAATRGAIGFGAGLLLAGKFRREKTKGAGLDTVLVRPGEYDPDRPARIREKRFSSRPLGSREHSRASFGFSASIGSR